MPGRLVKCRVLPILLLSIFDASMSKGHHLRLVLGEHDEMTTEGVAMTTMMMTMTKMLQIQHCLEQPLVTPQNGLLRTT